MMITTINIKNVKIIVPVDFLKGGYVVIGIFCVLLTFTHFLFGAWRV